MKASIKAYTPEEITLLNQHRAAKGSSVALKTLAKEMGRPFSGVQAKIYSLNQADAKMDKKNSKKPEQKKIPTPTIASNGTEVVFPGLTKIEIRKENDNFSLVFKF